MTSLNIIIANESAHTDSGWVFCGLPAEDMPKAESGLAYDGDGFAYAWHKDLSQRGVRVLVKVPAQTKLSLKLTDTPWTPPEFVLHPSIAQKPDDILPQFWLGARALSLVDRIAEQNAVMVRWLLRYRDEARNVTLDCHLTAYSMCPNVDFVVHAVYGTTSNNGQAQTAQLPQLVMAMRSRCVVDFGRRNGQETTTVHGWTMANIAPAQLWHRASRVEMRGSILSELTPSLEQGFRMFGLWDNWAGKWMACGQVPQMTPDLAVQLSRLREQYRAQDHVGYSAERPRAQPRNSGQTGEQADFGAASDLAVTAGNCWEIHDALWQCQAYAQRPTGNREPDGKPMQAALHPSAETFNQRPDLNFGEADRLGWPGINQIAWIPSPNTTLWTTSDDQHRADNLLHATYALTGDPGLRQIIQDHVELDRLDVSIRRRLLLSPRSIGRLALTRANQLWLGFDSENTMVIGIEAALSAAPLTRLPADRTVRTFGGYEQAKYGWNSSQGAAIIGWQPWQESIAAIGLHAAIRQLRGSDELKRTWLSALEQLTHTINNNAWRRFDEITATGQAHAYAIRWNDGIPFAASDWPVLFAHQESWNDNLYVSNACDYWTAAAQHLSGDATWQPATAAQARWLAV